MCSTAGCLRISNHEWNHWPYVQTSQDLIHLIMQKCLQGMSSLVNLRQVLADMGCRNTVFNAKAQSAAMDLAAFASAQAVQLFGGDNFVLRFFIAIQGCNFWSTCK